MASHHHHHGCCNPSTATTSAFCCCCPNYTLCHHHPPLDSHLLHHHHPPPPQSYLYSPYSNSPYATQSLHQQQQRSTQRDSSPTDFREGYFRQLHHRQRGGLSNALPGVSSLIRRITALESSLHHQSSSHSHSLRDAAARTIQTHFRAFLLRRSRTLRQLKDLASIRSTINVLKSSLSDYSRLDRLAISHQALHLLLKFDSIQGDDPMIRDGKKSVGRELTRLMDLIDEVTVQRSELSRGFIRKHARNGESSKKCRELYSNEKMGNVSGRDLQRDERLEDLVKRVEALYNKVSREEDGEENEELESPRISLIGKNGVPQTRDGFRLRPDALQAKVKKSEIFREWGCL